MKEEKHLIDVEIKPASNFNKYFKLAEYSLPEEKRLSIEIEKLTKRSQNSCQGLASRIQYRLSKLKTTTNG